MSQTLLGIELISSEQTYETHPRMLVMCPALLAERDTRTEGSTEDWSPCALYPKNKNAARIATMFLNIDGHVPLETTLWMIYIASTGTFPPVKVKRSGIPMVFFELIILITMYVQSTNSSIITTQRTFRQSIHHCRA